MKIVCKLPYASEDIDGIQFKKRGDAMVSEDVDKETADRFAAIPGFSVLTTGKDDDADAEAKAAAKAEKEAEKAAKAAAKA